jgi:predicted CopG family antitoxin
MKTITLDEEAYGILRGLKQGQGDSFSDVVKRYLGQRRAADVLERTAGAWDDVSDEDVRALRDEMLRGFGTTKDRK